MAILQPYSTATIVQVSVKNLKITVKLQKFTEYYLRVFLICWNDFLYITRCPKEVIISITVSNFSVEKFRKISIHCSITFCVSIS